MNEPQECDGCGEVKPIVDDIGSISFCQECMDKPLGIVDWCYGYDYCMVRDKQSSIDVEAVIIGMHYQQLPHNWLLVPGNPYCEEELKRREELDK
jgi:hypothetical protein